MVSPLSRYTRSMKRLIIAVLLLTAGCTAQPSGPGVASVNGSAQPSAAATGDPVAFARCMREHGQDVPDPQPGQGWSFGSKDRPAGWDEAMQACRHLLPTTSSQQGPTAQELEQLRAFAVCMRAHEIEMSDPETEGDRIGNMTIRGRLEHVTRAQLEADPVFQAAMEACRDKLPDSDPHKKGGQ